jgi:hypothetical protein
MANLGLPTASAGFRLPHGEEHPDPGVMAVDAVVLKLEPVDRSIVIRKFQHQWPVRQFMREYQWSVRRYYAELEGAVRAVDSLI